MDLKALLPLLAKAFDDVAYPALIKEIDLIPNPLAKELVILLMPVLKKMVDDELAKLAA